MRIPSFMKGKFCENCFSPQKSTLFWNIFIKSWRNILYPSRGMVTSSELNYRCEKAKELKNYWMSRYEIVLIIYHPILVKHTYTDSADARDGPSVSIRSIRNQSVLHPKSS